MLGFRGAAGVAQGAFGTAGVARRADQRAELHPRLVGGAGPVARQPFVGAALEFLPRGGPADVVGQGEQAGKDADHVAVEHGERLAEGEGRDGGDGVGPQAGEGGERGGIGRQAPAVVAHEDLRGSVDLAGAGIVAEAFPQLEDVPEGGGGQRGGIGKPGEKAPEIGHDGVYPRLLQHDFRDPDGVGRPRFRAPRQVARVAREPRQQAVPDDGRHVLDPVSGHGKAW